MKFKLGLCQIGGSMDKEEARKNAENHVRQAAEKLDEMIQAKLDSIGAGVEDIRVEMRTIRSRVDGLSERVSAVESSVKSAHHRLDQLEKGGTP